MTIWFMRGRYLINTPVSPSGRYSDAVSWIMKVIVIQDLGVAEVILGGWGKSVIEHFTVRLSVAQYRLC